MSGLELGIPGCTRGEPYLGVRDGNTAEMPSVTLFEKKTTRNQKERKYGKNCALVGLIV
jgi:hypothetical protein